MKQNLLITFTSTDRPGIVERLTSAVVAEGGNWQESRLAKLGGDFAGIAIVSLESSRIPNLTDRLEALAGDGLRVTVKPAVASEVGQRRHRVQLTCSGADHEGIVNRLAAYLTKQGINVEEMETEIAPAPTTGTPIFRMTSMIGIPDGIARTELIESLHNIAGELSVDLTLDGQNL